MATRQEIIDRAKEIIEAYPTAGKSRINQYLRMEYGKGLRSGTILQLKREVGTEKPFLFPELYQRGSVPRGLNAIYRGWIKAGFMPFEARELTTGHGDRYLRFDARSVFDSIPARLARESRMKWLDQLVKRGWTKEQIRAAIIDYYKKSRKVDPWEHIRAEYKPRKRVDFRDYQIKARQRARARQRRLMRQVTRR